MLTGKGRMAVILSLLVVFSLVLTACGGGGVDGSETKVLKCTYQTPTSRYTMNLTVPMNGECPQHPPRNILNVAQWGDKLVP